MKSDVLASDDALDHLSPVAFLVFVRKEQLYDFRLKAHTKRRQTKADVRSNIEGERIATEATT